MQIPEKIYVTEGMLFMTNPEITLQGNGSKIEYTRTDVFIERACEWIKENITNNPNANSVSVRNGCVTLGMLIEDFKKYMKE